MLLLIDAAMMELTKKGLIPATRKTNPVALDGLLAVASMKGAAAVIEINSETNSVARNEIFCHLVCRVSFLCIQSFKFQLHHEFMCF